MESELGTKIVEWGLAIVAAGGGGAVIAFGIFKFFGQNWIKHLLAKDLEVAKSEISFHAAKRAKLHDKEYEVFPEIWALLCEAQASLAACLLEMRTFPDFTRFDEESFNHWLDSTDLNEDEKHVMIEAADRHATLNRILDLRNLKRAEKDYLKFQDCLQVSRIFISPDIRDMFVEVQQLFRKVWAAKKTDFDLTNQGEREQFFIEALNIYDDEVKPLISKLEKAIQVKLFPASEGEA